MVKDELNNTVAPNGTPQQDGGAAPPAKSEDKQQADDQNLEPEQFRKMFIGGLTATTSDEMLRDYYSQWGELVDCVVMRDPNTKRSRGFGFVSYSKQSEVDLAMTNRPHVIDNKTVDPKRAVPREQSQRSEANISSKRLYVSGVREEHTEEMFVNHFSKYGTVLKAEIIMDKNTGKPRGFAFITFDDYDAVDKCVLHKSHMISNYRCDVKKALSKEEMSKAQQSERERMDRGGRSRGNMRGQWGGPMGGRGGPGGYDSRDSAWGVSGWGPSQGSSGGWGGAPARGGPSYGKRGAQQQQGGYGGGAGGYGGGYQQQGGSSAWGAPTDGWGAPQPWGGQGWGQAPGGPSSWQGGSSQGSATGGWNQGQSAGGWGGRQAGGLSMASATQAPIVAAKDAPLTSQVDEALQKLEEKLTTVNIDKQTPEAPKYAGRFDMQLGAITQHNVLQLKVINQSVFPVSYNDKFYKDVVAPQNENLGKFAYFNDIVVGAVCCRYSNENGERHLYIMTLGTLAPYRRLGIGTMMLNYVFEICEKEPSINSVRLHVQTSNKEALEFYQKFGFEVVETVKDYYKRIEPNDAFYLVKKIDRK
ncbi:hypothetical protein QR680_019127 [Steinernema hermaphroditum]|uniref:Uncharacterized protein n=1 Tax=Steinernema hermaphroditum TaxID=289476 RepID=A0AA39HK10_9BILA|nr:hypothetical protein QR680_019127 [Steinernema hermaphroditum]